MKKQPCFIRANPQITSCPLSAEHVSWGGGYAGDAPPGPLWGVIPAVLHNWRLYSWNLKNESAIGIIWSSLYLHDIKNVILKYKPKMRYRISVCMVIC